MKIIVPVLIDDTTLDSTNVTETDHTNWVTATSYSVGDVRQETTPNIHTVYECSVAHTSDADNRPSVEVDPDTGIGPNWFRVSATNPWSMFTDQISDQTEKATEILVTIVPGEVVNGISLFNLEGTEVNVEVDDPVDGIVYDRTISLVDNTGIDNWSVYFFNPIIQKTDIALLDLPPYSTADINVTISAPSSTAKCGLLTLGYQQALGIAEHGTTVGIIDYSRKEQDQFGRPIVIQRNFSKTADFSVLVQTNRISYVQNLLASLRTTPVTWIGNEDDGATIIYGYYKDFSLVYRDIFSSPATIEVEGLT